ncbi:MAG: hypothetical protein ACI4SS_01330 [Clostridia bacterium]
MKRLISTITAFALALSATSAFAETVITNFTSTTTCSGDTVEVVTNINGNEVVSVYEDGVLSTQTNDAAEENEVEVTAEPEITVEPEVTAEPEIKPEETKEEEFNPSEGFIKWLRDFVKECIKEVLAELEAEKSEPITEIPTTTTVAE